MSSKEWKIQTRFLFTESVTSFYSSGQGTMSWLLLGRSLFISPWHSLCLPSRGRMNDMIFLWLVRCMHQQTPLIKKRNTRLVPISFIWFDWFVHGCPDSSEDEGVSRRPCCCCCCCCISLLSKSNNLPHLVHNSQYVVCTSSTGAGRKYYCVRYQKVQGPCSGTGSWQAAWMCTQRFQTLMELLCTSLLAG
jgi:hypothetical protein